MELPEPHFPQLCTGTEPRLTVTEEITLRTLLKHHHAEEILPLGELLATLPAGDDTLKAFAGGLLGASQARGKAYLQALQIYNDGLVQ